MMCGSRSLLAGSCSPQAIGAIEPDVWVAIRYPNAIYDGDTVSRFSDADHRIQLHSFRVAPDIRADRGPLVARRVKYKNTPEQQGQSFAE